MKRGRRLHQTRQERTERLYPSLWFYRLRNSRKWQRNFTAIWFVNHQYWTEPSRPIGPRFSPTH